MSSNGAADLPASSCQLKAIWDKSYIPQRLKRNKNYYLKKTGSNNTEATPTIADVRFDFFDGIKILIYNLYILSVLQHVSKGELIWSRFRVLLLLQEWSNSSDLCCCSLEPPTSPVQIKGGKQKKYNEWRERRRGWGGHGRGWWREGRGAQAKELKLQPPYRQNSQNHHHYNCKL